MKQTDIEVKKLKASLTEMWALVEQQVRKSIEAVLNNDQDLAREIISREKSVNAQELTVDRQCENFIALFNPVAIDLRFVLSLLKINNNLERIGDFAESIALFVVHNQQGPLDEKLIEQVQIKLMFETVVKMMEQTRSALAREDSRMASRVLSQDDVVDLINREAVPVLANYIASHPEKTVQTINFLNVVRRVERIGDRLSNIAEDIVFYVDAKELRHGFQVAAAKKS